MKNSEPMQMILALEEGSDFNSAATVEYLKNHVSMDGT
jgi:hypothetical protein